MTDTFIIYIIKIRNCIDLLFDFKKVTFLGLVYTLYFLGLSAVHGLELSKLGLFTDGLIC